MCLLPPFPAAAPTWKRAEQFKKKFKFFCLEKRLTVQPFTLSFELIEYVAYNTQVVLS